MFLIALAGLGLAASAELWSQSRQRDKEAELLWVGEQFRQAIGLYYQRSPGSTKRYPERLEDLLEDRRFLSIQRYLRRIYSDPISGKPDWGVIPAPGGGIMGVHSVAPGKPIRSPASRDGGPPVSSYSYQDWKFTYVPTDQRKAPPASPK